MPDPFTIGLGVEAGIGVLGSILGGAAATRARNHALSGERNYQGELRNVLSQETGRLSPHAGLANQALGQLLAGQAAGAFDARADVYNNPSYQNSFAEGQRAVNRGASARGRLNAGAHGRALARYGSQVASREYGNEFSRDQSVRDRAFGRLSGLYSQGLDSSHRLGAVRQRVGFGIAESQNRIGQINAQGSLASAGAANTLLRTGENIAGAYINKGLGANQEATNSTWGDILSGFSSNPLSGPSYRYRNPERNIFRQGPHQ